MSLLQLPAAKYYADDAETFGPVPTLSYSIAKLLLMKSPLHAWRAHPRLGNCPDEPTKEMGKGTLIHQLLSGDAEPANIEVHDVEDYRGGRAKLRDDAIARGLTPMKRREYEACKAAAQSVIDAAQGWLGKLGITLAGQREVTLTWTETADDGTPVLCRCLMDHFDGFFIDDYKSCENAHPNACEAAIRANWYDMQRAAYTSAADQNFPTNAGRHGFRNIFVEVNAPHLITPVHHDGSLRALGMAKWRRAVNLWAKCLRENHWRGYTDSVFTATAKQWDIAAEMQESPNDSTLAPFTA